MSGSTLTKKGQVTVPKPVRDALGIRAGDRVSFLVRDDGVVDLRPETVDLKDLYWFLKYGGKAASVEEMDQGIAEAASSTTDPSAPRPIPARHMAGSRFGGARMSVVL